LPDKLGEGLRGILARWGLGAVWDLHEVMEAFPKVFKPYPGARFLDFSRGVLRVGVRSAALRHELVMRKPELIKAMNALLGRELVKDILFTRGAQE